MNGWLFDHARILASQQHSGLAVLMLTTSYFELITAFTRGETSENKSRKFFCEGMAEVFPDTLATIKANKQSEWESIWKGLTDAVYDDLRCGLFHEGMFKSRTIIRDG